MKKLFTAILASSMILSTMTAMASEVEITEQPQVIETQTLSYAPSDDVIQVGDFLIRPNSTTENTCSFMAYVGTDTVLDVPETIGGYTVNEMGRTQHQSSLDVLYYNNNVQSLRLPNTVKRAQIWSWTEITGLHLSNQLEYLSVDDMPKIAQVDLPDSLMVIYMKGCTSLTSIDLPDNIMVLGKDSFKDCSSLTEIYIPDGVRNLDTGSFSGCSSLTKVRLPRTITQLPGGVFQHCTSLTEVIIPDEISYLGGSNFVGCTSLTSVYLSGNITKMGVGEFSLCSSLTTINYGGSEEDRDNMSIHSIGNEILESATWVYNSTEPDENTPFTPETTPDASPTPTSPIYDPWAEPQVNFSQEHGLTVDSLGSDYTKDITREQIADLLVNMVEKASGATLPTNDVKFTDTSSEAVSKASKAGIISGKDVGIFAPDATATRQEISIMIVRAIEKLEEISGETYIDHSLTSLTGFSDFTDTADWAKDFVAILANNGIMSGSDGNLTPLSATSIQQCLVLNNNLYQLGN